MGLATSMNSTFRYLGSSVGAPIAGAVLSAFVVTSVVSSNVTFSFPTNTAYFYAFLIGGISFIMSAFLVIFAKEILGKRSVGNEQAERAQPYSQKEAEAPEYA